MKGAWPPGCAEHLDMNLNLCRINLIGVVFITTMVARSTHIYQTVGALDIELDVYTKFADQAQEFLTPNLTIFLFLHGGGLVGFNRRLLPAHVVQSCLKRGWPLVSADYRLLPQVDDRDVVDDVQDAYEFVREKRAKAITGEEGKIVNVILGGASGGEKKLMHNTPIMYILTNKHTF
jgi:hypothetical protein